MSILTGIENEGKKVLAFFEKDGAEVVHVVTVIGGGCEELGKLLVDGKQLEPAAKTALTTVIDDAEAVATAITVAGAAAGANWTADATAVAAVEKLVPDVVALLKLLKADASVLLPNAAA